MVGVLSVSFTASSTCTVLAVLFAHLFARVESGSSGKCSWSVEETQHQANSCLEAYKTFEDSHRLTGSHLFTSVDVEIIRTLCSNLKSSVRCLKSLKSRCSSTQHHNKIDSLVRPYTHVVELCDHQRLYEEYAMNQNCLHGQRDTSEHCYRTFQGHVATLEKSQHSHLQQYCGYLEDLVSCVRSNFAITCGETSSLLMELLVRSAIKDSYRCRVTSSHDSTITVSPQKSSRLGSRRSNSAPSVTGSGGHLALLILTLLLFYVAAIDIHNNGGAY